ncbi:MAG: GNAT family N-acetyltransferase [Roseburia sp.]|nr:GNAT family N-acetyltransferase [Ruminococcus sp.]MCM1153992.1 GNAT family N-acetyltransferase [Roseburia sp.]MCM1242357.1 GNAT family N-acetyltransferase [Roseburia sp.]
MTQKADVKIYSDSGPIYLRHMTLEDTDSIITWRNTPRVRDNFIYRRPFTRESHLNWIRTQIEPGHVVQFMICEASSGRAVGSVYLRDIDREKGCAEYGIFIGEEDALGKGYASEAAGLAVTYAFEELALDSLFLRVFADNTAARRSYERAGFCLIEGKTENIETEEGIREMVFYQIENSMRK